MPENSLAEDPTRVFLLIENRLVRETLVRLLRKRPDLTVAGFGRSVEAIDVLDFQCDILVLDDLEALSHLGASFRERQEMNDPVRIVLIGMEDDEQLFLLAVRAGIAAYLLNDASASDVVTAVRCAARGEAVCPPRLCLTLFGAASQLAREMPAQIKPRSQPGLTIRQQQLISLVAKGLTNKEIAERLSLSQFTIKNHMHRIMKQVEAVSRSQAVEFVRASGYQVAP